MEARDSRFSLLDTKDAAVCCGRAENRVSHHPQLVGSGPGVEGKRAGGRALAGSRREERVLGLLGRWLGLVEAMAGSAERPSVGD